MNGKLIAILSVAIATLTLGLGYAYMGDRSTSIEHEEAEAVRIRSLNDNEADANRTVTDEPFTVVLAPEVPPSSLNASMFSERDAVGAENAFAAEMNKGALDTEKKVSVTPKLGSETTASPKPELRVTAPLKAEPETALTPKLTSKITATLKSTPRVKVTPEPTPKATATPKPTNTPKPAQKATAAPKQTSTPKPKVTATLETMDRISEKMEAPDMVSESTSFIIGGGESGTNPGKDVIEAPEPAPTPKSTEVSEQIVTMNRIPSFAVSGDYDWESLELATRVAYYEAGDEAGRKAVLNVILNRCRSKDFGGRATSVEKEVYRKSQFSVVKKEGFETFTAPDSLIRMADAIFNKGETVLPDNIVFFRAAGRGTEWDGKDYYDTIGGNAFFSAS